jgi:nucleoid-associated protein YgaU
MQPIERYALVTLLFLIVLIVVGALWDDGEVGAAEGPVQEISRAERANSRSASGTLGSSREQALPLNVREPAPEVSRQRTAAPQRQAATQPEASNVRREEATSPARSAGAAPATAYVARRSGSPGRPGAPSPQELEGSMRPEPRKGWAGGYLDARNLTSAASPSRAEARPAATSDELALGARRRGADRGAEPRPRAEVAEVTPPKTRAYTIRGGDSLEAIARRELGDPRAVDRIASLNGIAKPYTIYSGRTLMLPVSNGGASTNPSARTSSAPDASAQVSATAGGRPIYTVRSGDSSLSVVLERQFGTYKRSLPLVKTLNPGLDPNQIRVGMKIVMPRADEIPGGASVASASSAPTRGSSTESASPAVSTPREFIVR